MINFLRCFISISHARFHPGDPMAGNGEERLRGQLAVSNVSTPPCHPTAAVKSNTSCPTGNGSPDEPDKLKLNSGILGLQLTSADRSAHGKFNRTKGH